MQGARKIAWYVVAVLAVMSGFAIFMDAHGIFDLLGVILWCTWAPLLLALMLHKMPTLQSIKAYVTFGAFWATSLAAVVILGFISFAVLSDGPLNESALIFIVFPYAFIQAAVIGALVGSVAWWFMNRRHNA